MAKEYGKLTAEQFRDFIGKLPEVRRQREEFGQLLTELPKGKFDSLMVRGFNWGEIYEKSFPEHIATAIVAFGKVEWMIDLSKAPDVQQATLDRWPTEDDDEDTHPDFSPQDLVGLAYSLQRTILSVMLFQRSLSGLIQEVRENDDIDALFNAVRVDRAAMSCTTIADKIARAEMRHDKKFFLRLRNALKGPTQKHWAAYCDLRYSLYTLRELGLDKLSDTQLENLLVHHLKVYPNTPSARKNLRAQYQQSKRIKTI
jgi:hypothetical protein